MKKLLFLFLGGLLITGAGCATSTENDVTIEDITLPGSGQTAAEPSVAEAEPLAQTWEFPGKLPDEQIAGKQVRISTEYGDIVFELFNETAPLTVSNFVYLAEGGYYDGLTFHRRVEGFVVQGGDPRGTGTGGPGYKFADELDDDYAYDRGIVAMANSGPDTNGSQFFIMLKDNPTLPKAYTVFGRVTEGMDAVDQLQIGDVMSTVVIEDKN